MFNSVPDVELIFDKRVLGEIEREERIDQIRSLGKRYKYMLKTIVSGNMVESEIYPVYEKKSDMPRADKKLKSKQALENLNHKNSKKQLVRLINCNFTKGDLIVTLTYDKKPLPNEKKAVRDVQDYLRKVRDYRKKHNMSPLKYIYVVEFVEDDESTHKVRLHHHIIMSGMDRDTAESFWKKGRKNSKKAEPDDFGLEGFAIYMANHTRKRKKRGWHPSRNLKKPKVYKSITKLTKKKAETMAKRPELWQSTFEKLYKDKYRYLNCDIYYSDITGGFYLRAKMKKRN